MLLFCDLCRQDLSGDKDDDGFTEIVVDSDEVVVGATNACVAALRRATNSSRRVDLAAMVADFLRLFGFWFCR